MSDSNFISQLAQKLRMLGAMHAVGETWISFDGTIPAGGVPCCGQTVQRSLYADLFAWAQAQGRVKTESEWQELASAQDGNCAYYSDGDGSTTFRMPAVLSYLRGSASAGAAGTFVEEGLPNIEAAWYSAFENGDLKSAESTGAVTSTVTTGIHSEIPNTAGNTTVSRKFSAQTDNAIYGNSDHVTPRTSCVLVGVYAVSVLTNTASADVAQIQTALAALESEVGALPSPTAYVTQTWTSDDGLSWYRKWSDGWIEQGGKIPTRNYNSSWFTISMSLSFLNTSYQVFTTNESTDVSEFGWFKINKDTKTKNSFQVSNSHNNESQGGAWHACGF